MAEIICFDLDNTLIRSDAVHVAAFNTGLRKIGFSEVPFTRMVHLFGRPKPEVIALLTPGATKKQREVVRSVHDRVLHRKGVQYARRIPGVVGTLKRLQKEYTLALTSNCGHSSILKLMKQAKLDPTFFSLLVGHTDVARSKPYPDEINYVRKKLKGKVAYMVGDSVYDIRAAHAARVKAIGVLTGHYTREILKKEKPYKILNSVCELPDVIL